MSDFEKEYYESGTFWDDGMLQDENNRRRIELTAEMIPAGVSSLADIGCGNGVFVNYLATQKPGLRLMAVDRSQAALKFVQTEKMEGDIASVPLPDRSFDLVTCLEVIEHLPVTVYAKALSELARLAGKYVIVSVPYAEILEKNYTQCPGCKTIFNADLHLRNFSEDKMKGLLELQGFSCKTFQKAGGQKYFKGHERFVRTFYPDYYKNWRSPICPLCGYKEAAKTSTQGIPAEKRVVPESAGQRSLLSYFTTIPKLFWPKETRYYWIIALYERKQP